MHINNSIKEYLDDLAAKKPTPGGGSSAALVGAAGAALISMVCNFTLGKKNYKEFERDINKILSGAESIRKELMQLVDKDVEAYKKFSSSNKDEKALKEVLSAPFRVCELTHDALKFCPELVWKGNRLLVSDVGCAAEFLEGAFLSALFNVEINLAGIKDKDFIVKIKKTVRPMKKEVSFTKDTVVENVNKFSPTNSHLRGEEM